MKKYNTLKWILCIMSTYTFDNLSWYAVTGRATQGKKMHILSKYRKLHLYAIHQHHFLMKPDAVESDSLSTFLYFICKSRKSSLCLLTVCRTAYSFSGFSVPPATCDVWFPCTTCAYIEYVYCEFCESYKATKQTRYFWSNWMRSSAQEGGQPSRDRERERDEERRKGD